MTENNNFMWLYGFALVTSEKKKYMLFLLKNTANWVVVQLLSLYRVRLVQNVYF